ncbi:hypothetical protein PENSPDRAFT_695178 [Peniophora sp. CONT]|nr:hypothetical protein PENSPDRAFT_695178 [Peniophora sp. CONT]
MEQSRLGHTSAESLSGTPAPGFDSEETTTSVKQGQVKSFRATSQKDDNRIYFFKVGQPGDVQVIFEVTNIKRYGKAFRDIVALGQDTAVVADNSDVVPVTEEGTSKDNPITIDFVSHRVFAYMVELLSDDNRKFYTESDSEYEGEGEGDSENTYRLEGALSANELLEAYRNASAWGMSYVRNCTIKEMEARATQTPYWGAIQYIYYGFCFKQRKWVTKGVRHICKRPLRSFDPSDLDLLASIGIERDIVFHKEWIDEHRHNLACMSPPFVGNGFCRMSKQCKAAWEWAWADGVRVSFVHPTRSKEDWDIKQDLKSASGKVPFLCTDCHDASFEALAKHGIDLHQEDSKHARFVERLAERW